MRCYIFKYPDNELSIHYKVKEKYVVDFIRQEFPDQNIVFDKKIDGGCSKRRPDAFIDLLTHALIIECDEGALRSAGGRTLELD